MADSPLQSAVQALAETAGFPRAGLAALPSEPDADAQRDYLEAWIAEGHAGEMEYLKRRNALGQLVRASLPSAVPWARSVVVCAAPYDADLPLSTDLAPPGTGWIARYAWSGLASPDGTLRPSDYHKVLLARLKKLERALHEHLPDPWQSLAYVDTGPIIERAWAEAAGIGWTGKNTCTLSQELGSFFFLGVILTSLDVAEEARPTIAADRCGSCTRCLDACPTQALIAPRRMDASRCISYLTIEKRGSIPDELYEGMGRQVFGCDICQDVCPWNTRARRIGPPAADPEMQPRVELINPSLDWLAGLTEAEFARLFHGSPVKRAKYAGLRRNVAIAMGNSGQQRFQDRLEAWAGQADDPVLSEAAAWALKRLPVQSRPAAL